MTEPLEEIQPNLEKEIYIKFNLKTLAKAMVILLILGGIAGGIYYSYKNGYNKGYKLGYVKGEAKGKQEGKNLSDKQQSQDSKEQFIDGYITSYGDNLGWWVKSNGFYVIEVENKTPLFFELYTADIKDWSRFKKDKPKLSIANSIKMVPSEDYFIKGDAIWTRGN